MTIGNIGMGLATILGIVIVSLVILCFFTMQLWNWHQGKTGTKEIKNILISFLVGVLTTIILTEVFQARIFFSFFIAAPIGLIVVITVFIYLNRKKIK